MRPFLRGCLVLLLLCTSSLIGVEAGLTYPRTLPSRSSDCLYFSDNNGFAQVLGFNATQGAIVAEAQKTDNDTNVIDQVRICFCTAPA